MAQSKFIAEIMINVQNQEEKRVERNGKNTHYFRLG